MVILRAVHLLAAVVWVGSMIFLSVVVIPALRKSLSPLQLKELVQIIGRRYRVVGWMSILILIITGLTMLYQESAAGIAWDSGYGRVLSLKLALVGVMLVLTSLHDFVLGMRAAKANHPADAMRLRQAVVYLARLNLWVALGILLCGVWLTGV